MIFTEEELHAYRSLVGLQVQYAQQGDSHKVMELQIKLEDWIKGCAEIRAEAAVGRRVSMTWTEQAKAAYRERCADAMAKADLGFTEWSFAQRKIEQWVVDYIRGGVMQAILTLNN